MPKEVGQHFQRFVDAGQPVGEVVAVNSFLITVRGLQPVNVHALVTFDDGSKGFVQHVLEDTVQVLHLGTTKLKVGSLAVLQHTELMTRVGKDFVGRVVSVNGEPLDGKGTIAADFTWPIFNTAPAIYEREMLNEQLETGVTALDALFPIVRGQRLALLGDSKSGKTTLATQIAINQKNTDQIVIYVLIAKRRSDIDTLLTRLRDNGSMEKSIVIVSTVFESLVLSYLAPYVGCAMGEYFWQSLGQDAVVIYDDLTAHAHAHREIALLSRTSPGRDSYPGDMFHAHSSLLERAGRLAANKKSLTAIPLVLVDGGDITAYLPTNIMSITDGQWILDMSVFREGMRPAVNTGLSVTRVGGRGHNDRQKNQAGQILKALAAFAQAKEFAHFGSEIGPTAQHDMLLGGQLQQLLIQVPGENYSLMAQQLMLDIILDPKTPPSLNIAALKRTAIDAAKQVNTEEDFQRVRQMLLDQVSGVVA
ncbi:MAG TPA: sodium-transporting two-sector ATPase [Candidatus Saccharimonadales bacterium]|nr:sodium-transporting two-sector ATPase [Candidatus Saccharimonadales bacterium]